MHSVKQGRKKKEKKKKEEKEKEKRSHVYGSNVLSNLSRGLQARGNQLRRVGAERHAHVGAVSSASDESGRVHGRVGLVDAKSVPRVDRPVNEEGVGTLEVKRAVVGVGPADALLEVLLSVRGAKHIVAHLQAERKGEQVAKHVREGRVGSLVEAELLGFLTRARWRATS